MNPGSDDHEEDTQAECVVLQEVLTLHPDHLTIPELILKVALDPEDHAEAETIAHAIRDLRASGLVRCVGGIVEPTHAALRFAALGI